MNQRGLELFPNVIINEIDFIFKKLEEHNISVHKSNRFLQFKRDYANLIKTDNLEENFSELVEGVRDFFELRSIVSSQALLNDSPNELKEIINGNRLPSEDANSISRNLQYQLYIASQFSNSGMIIKCVEPDFTFEYEKITYAVAAKRIASKNQLLKRIKEAEKQIMQQEYDGFIALSLDQLLSVNNPFIITDDPDEIVNATNELLLGLVKELFLPSYFESRNKKVKGFILTIGVASFIPRLSAFGYGFNLKMFPLTEKNDESEFLKIAKINEALMIDKNKEKR